ncbi:hypothetical protein DPMN_006895 [Dreissena polymorpha]|uniref:Uncharacterized protein n=1 Tax=Dreissena polymorpha TaxID=45954 RepID=A0A9D4MSQ4_DREPO|nr:hypothetical protein DPMN_006895 [Dreissena polymorpha]
MCITPLEECHSSWFPMDKCDSTYYCYHENTLGKKGNTPLQSHTKLILVFISKTFVTTLHWID